jgi:hypothetical protein
MTNNTNSSSKTTDSNKREIDDNEGIIVFNNRFGNYEDAQNLENL